MVDLVHVWRISKRIAAICSLLLICLCRKRLLLVLVQMFWDANCSLVYGGFCFFGPNDKSINYKAVVARI